MANTLAAHGLVLLVLPPVDERLPRAPCSAAWSAAWRLMLAAVVAGVLLLGLPKLPLAVSLLSYFVLFLIMELSILHRRTSAPAGAAR